MTTIKDNITENFPFISVILYGGSEYVGIVINQDQHVTSIYNYELLKSEEERKEFLELGETWWWESNRTIPINIFLKLEMTQFKHAIVTMNTKDVTVTLGPVVNMQKLATKRIKRKTIQLVRKPPS